MTQRPRNTDLEVDHDELEQRVAALERMMAPAYGNIETVADIKNLVDGQSTSIDTNTSKALSLAQRIKILEQGTQIPRVKTLPTANLTDDMVVAWQTAAPFGQNYGVTWMMKYRKGVTYPWECIGGQDMTSWVSGFGSIRNFGTPGNFTALAQLQGDNVQDLPIPYAGEWRTTLDIGYSENFNSDSANFYAAQICHLDSAGNNIDGYDFRKAALVFANPATSYRDGFTNVEKPLGRGVPIHREASYEYLANQRVGVRYTCTRDYASFYGLFFSLRPVRVKT